MLKRLWLFVTLLTLGYTALAQDFPEKPNTLVNDYTNTLSADEKQRLEDKLVAYNDSTSTQLAVVIIKSIGDYDIDEYGTMLGRKWGIGQKGKNNGVLLLVALNDHKVTIQTGYGAEGALTDAATQTIIQQDIKPNFKQNNYFAGLDAATTDIFKYLKGEFKADPNQQKQTDDGGGGSAVVIIIIIVVVLILVFRNRGGGGGGQVIGSRGSSSPFWWFLAGNMLGGGGSRGSGWGGGGGFGGGSSGGGGFGGFGGGSFGGGGSSGSW
ncbi:TPM domain-containing protein [Mucilaginibacter robiniae]|uniref:TPM domain-containing protein n=1 Tax=Mucilaginibacter robiniae TaxID=2728022 RepID=A0A7L5E3T0_9SPHI|nr:TPM domain-containing protein [Mucilaginibacter robiniae]QJD95006.1 TPM domain-containing protein [Mucilaginibacter robiniae]